MLAYEGEVMLVQTEGEMARALNFLKKETLLGFDTESRPSFKKGKSYPTSLIQLAGSELVVLIRLNLTPFCGALAGLLADPGIIKAGVAIRDDIRALQKLREKDPHAAADPLCRHRCVDRPGNLFTYDGSGVKSGEGTLLKKGIPLPSPAPLSLPRLLTISNPRSRLSLMVKEPAEKYLRKISSLFSRENRHGGFDKVKKF